MTDFAQNSLTRRQVLDDIYNQRASLYSRGLVPSHILIGIEQLRALRPLLENLVAYSSDLDNSARIHMTLTGVLDLGYPASCLDAGFHLLGLPVMFSDSGGCKVFHKISIEGNFDEVDIYEVDEILEDIRSLRVLEVYSD